MKYNIPGGILIILPLQIGINMNTKFSIFKRYRCDKNNQIIIRTANGMRQLSKYNKISGLDISITGTGNKIIVSEKTVFKGSKIIIEANNAVLEFNESPDINNLSVFVRNGTGQRLKWGKDTTLTGGYIELCETNASVTIGDDCMIGWHISIVATDFHSVLDRKTGKILNLPGGVEIGNHCWLGHGVRLLKNAKIPNNTIVGAETIVTKKFTEEWTVLGGNPACIVKRDVTWDRRLPTNLAES